MNKANFGLILLKMLLININNGPSVIIFNLNKIIYIRKAILVKNEVIILELNSYIVKI
jgi:hypothetical protein